MSSLELFRCGACGILFSVSAKDPDLFLLSLGTPLLCPNHPCKGTIGPFAKTNAKVKAIKVTASELYQAREFGLKEERSCGPKDITKLLEGATIASVEVEEGKFPHRALVRSITLKNGKTLHLGPSTLGVVATKVTEKKNVRR
jgi:hypothetical protein